MLYYYQINGSFALSCRIVRFIIFEYSLTIRNKRINKERKQRAKDVIIDKVKHKLSTTTSKHVTI